jgi:hypothetical protein
MLAASIAILWVVLYEVVFVEPSIAKDELEASSECEIYPFC